MSSAHYLLNYLLSLQTAGRIINDNISLFVNIFVDLTRTVEFVLYWKLLIKLQLLGISYPLI